MVFKWDKLCHQGARPPPQSVLTKKLPKRAQPTHLLLNRPYSHSKGAHFMHSGNSRRLSYARSFLDSREAHWDMSSSPQNLITRFVRDCLRQGIKRSPPCKQVHSRHMQTQQPSPKPYFHSHMGAYDAFIRCGICSST